MSEVPTPEGVNQSISKPKRKLSRRDLIGLAGAGGVLGLLLGLPRIPQPQPDSGIPELPASQFREKPMHPQSPSTTATTPENQAPSTPEATPIPFK